MLFVDFNSKWYAAFGWRLDERGDAEWAQFVQHKRANNRAIDATLAIFSKEFNDAKRDHRSNYRDIAPTLEEFKNLYFAKLPGWKVQWAAEDATEEHRTCTFCGGYGHVWGLVDQKGHEAEAPEHVMEIPAERLPEVYYGVQGYDCPVCRAAAYKDNAYRERVRRNTLPEYIPVGDPNNPHDYPECGARVILDTLLARIREARGDPLQAAGASGKDPLEAMFPMQDERERRRIENEELIAEERRVTAEMAGRFGPR